MKAKRIIFRCASERRVDFLTYVNSCEKRVGLCGSLFNPSEINPTY